MFNLKDFFHLPILDTALHQIIDEALPGIILVAGVNTHAASPLENNHLLTSGRSVFFDTFMQTYLGRHKEFTAVLVTQEKALTCLPAAWISALKSIIAFHRMFTIAILLAPSSLALIYSSSTGSIRRPTRLSSRPLRLACASSRRWIPSFQAQRSRTISWAWGSHLSRSTL
jgi:hypothetical protein